MLPFIDDAKKQVLDAFNAWKTDWTTERATKLDHLDANVSSRASEEKLAELDVKLDGLAKEETAILIANRISNPMSTNVNTVMGKLNSLLGFGEEVRFDKPGTYTWTVPEGVKKIKVMIIGAGGGGGGGAQKPDLGARINYTDEGYPLEQLYMYLYSSGAGGAGGYQILSIGVQAGEEFNVVVGAGGAGGAGGSVTGVKGVDGSVGGSSSFGAHVCTGGTGGKGGGSYCGYDSMGHQNQTNGGSGGTATPEIGTNVEVLESMDGKMGGHGRRERVYVATDVKRRTKNSSCMQVTTWDFTAGVFPSCPNWHITDIAKGGKNSIAPVAGNAGNGGNGSTGPKVGNINHSALENANASTYRYYVDYVSMPDNAEAAPPGEKGADGFVLITY